MLPSSALARKSSGPQIAMDERKRKRMESNRESARRSRMRKQQHLSDLSNQMAQLMDQNSQIIIQIERTTQTCIEVEWKNTLLRTQLMELTDRLQVLISVLHVIEEVSGIAMDIPKIPEQLLEPWQLSCPGLPIMTPGNVFQC